jgi:hypothetical protein
MDEGRPAHKADVTAMCEPILYKMWEPRSLNKPMGHHGLFTRMALNCLSHKLYIEDKIWN